MKIAVGGMIASGKSTLVNNLGKKLNLPILEEYEKEDNVFNTLLDWLYTGVADVEILLQIYFIHSHYLRQKEYGHNFIVDRDLIEHWIFAKTNLEKFPEVMNMYNGIFMAYMNQITKPDLYIILDITFEEFLNRLKQRGRTSETDNLDANLEYFKNLHSTYRQRLESQCIIYDIPYAIIDVNKLTEEEVLQKAMELISGKDTTTEPTILYKHKTVNAATGETQYILELSNGTESVVTKEEWLANKVGEPLLSSINIDDYGY